MTTKLPGHFFLSSTDGHLYDTRRPDWSHSKPVRRCYAWHYRQIETSLELKACLRAGEYAWPGGYQLFFITSDGAALSFDTVRAEFRNVVDSVNKRSDDGWRVIGLGCEAECEETVFDDHTGQVIFEA